MTTALAIVGTLLGSALTALVTARIERRKNEARNGSRYSRRPHKTARRFVNYGSSTAGGAGTVDKPPTKACWTQPTMHRGPPGNWHG